MTGVTMWKPPYSMAFMAMILFGLSVLADSGKTDDITIEDVKQHARDGDLIEFLAEKGGGSFASRFLDSPDQKEFKTWYVGQIGDNCDAMHGRERRKYGIKNRGICLLISYTAEIVQQGKDLTLRLQPMAPGSSRAS